MISEFLYNYKFDNAFELRYIFSIKFAFIKNADEKIRLENIETINPESKWIFEIDCAI